MAQAKVGAYFLCMVDKKGHFWYYFKSEDFI